MGNGGASGVARKAPTPSEYLPHRVENVPGLRHAVRLAGAGDVHAEAEDSTRAAAVHAVRRLPEEAMSVRVVTPIKCTYCFGHGEILWPGTCDIPPSSPGSSKPCPKCHGTGTVEREVFCRDCKWFFREHGVGQCGKIMTSVGYVEPGFACKAWEARE